MVPRIPQVWFEIVTGLLFGTAITTASIRLGIRLHIRRRLYWDDGFLGLACLFLLGATIILYRGFEILYLPENELDDFITNRRAEIADDVEPNDVTRLLGDHRNLRFIGPFCWLAIFSVKFSFLSFFHQLVHRLPRLLLYWKCVVLLNIIAFVCFVIWGLIACPPTDMGSLKCVNNKHFHAPNNFATNCITISIDIVTDILIISIPASILWQVRIKRLQKLKIGASLCLSICMIVIACIRSPGVQQSRLAVDLDIWQVFWMDVETCAAVCMVSLTAFRSVFASEATKVKGANIRPWYSSTVAKNRRRKQQDHDLGTLPTIPSATLSGMRTFIRGRDSLIHEEMGDLSGMRTFIRGRDSLIHEEMGDPSGRESIPNARKAASKFPSIGSEV